MLISGYRTADLHLCFGICKKAGFHITWLNYRNTYESSDEKPVVAYVNNKCTFRQADHSLYFLLFEYYKISCFCIQKSNTLATLCGHTGWFVFNLVSNPVDKAYKGHANMSLFVRKPVFEVSNQVPHKPGCTATEDGWRLEIWYLES